MTTTWAGASSSWNAVRQRCAKRLAWFSTMRQTRPVGSVSTAPATPNRSRTSRWIPYWRTAGASGQATAHHHPAHRPHVLGRRPPHLPHLAPRHLRVWIPDGDPLGQLLRPLARKVFGVDLIAPFQRPVQVPDTPAARVHPQDRAGALLRRQFELPL